MRKRLFVVGFLIGILSLSTLGFVKVENDEHISQQDFSDINYKSGKFSYKKIVFDLIDDSNVIQREKYYFNTHLKHKF